MNEKENETRTAVLDEALVREIVSEGRRRVERRPLMVGVDWVEWMGSAGEGGRGEMMVGWSEAGRGEGRGAGKHEE